MREHTTVVKPWFLDPAILFTFGVITVVIIGFIYLGMSVTDIQDEAFAEIDSIGCGELKDFITYERWDDYDARWTNIEAHARHVYTWTCEK